MSAKLTVRDRISRVPRALRFQPWDTPAAMNDKIYIVDDAIDHTAARQRISFTDLPVEIREQVDEEAMRVDGFLEIRKARSHNSTDSLPYGFRSGLERMGSCLQ
jgi:hypothetical protein